jgi:hypothetical protein
LNVDTSSVDLRDMLYDRETQSGPAHLSTTPLIDPIKTLEETGKMRGLDARTGIGYHAAHILTTTLG